MSDYMMKNYGFALFLMLVLLAGCASLPAPAELLPFSTATPTVTASPTATATPLPTPTPTPTPTPMPAEVLAMADAASEIGDWEMAAELYRRLTVLPGLDQEQSARTTLGLAEALIARDASSQAIALLDSFVTTAPQGAHTVVAHAYLAEALMEAGSPARASAHYQAVAEAYPVLAPYAYQWLGDVQFAAGDYTAALTAYQTAREAADTAGQQVFLWEKIALTHGALGSYEAAMAAYDTILGIAQIAGYRARIAHQAAETALAFGDTEEAYRRMSELVATYPTNDYAYEALIKLVNAGQPVDEMLRGLVDYHAGAYGPAVLAFYRVIEADPDHSGEPHYYAGLSYLEAGSPDLALNEFEVLIDTHPGDAYWGSAWIGKARALAALGETDAAIEAYRTLSESLPTHHRAASALWQAAELLAEAGRRIEAAEAFVDLADRYPDDEGAPDARFQAGLLYYREGDVPAAQEAWRALILWYPASDRAQAAHFWLGKTHLAVGETLSATAALSQAVALGPWDYYGLRAADLRAGRPPFATPGLALRACGSPQEQAEAEQWLARWLPLPAPTTTATLESSSPATSTLEGPATLPPPSPELLNDSRLRQGQLLLRLGRFEEGRAQLEALREATVGDPLTQYQLALIFRDLKLYRSSIIAAATVWQHSPSYDITTLPRFLGCLIYPTYFSELVEANAEALDLPPLLIYALLRQESLFEGFATSYAAAHGLMQVIPPTGAEIAESLAWPPGYETSDLYRPIVSVHFGTWYLAQQRDRFDGNLYAALAGYNGGPGNAARWLEAAGGDTDLFVELIAFRETRTYVERITEHFVKYHWLYVQ